MYQDLCFFRRPKQIISLKEIFIVTNFANNFHISIFNKANKELSIISDYKYKKFFDFFCNYNDSFFISFIDHDNTFAIVNKDLNHKIIFDNFNNHKIHQIFKYSKELDRLIFLTKPNNDIYLLDISNSYYELIASSNDYQMLNSINISDIEYFDFNKCFLLSDNSKNQIFELDPFNKTLNIIVNEGYSGKGCIRNPHQIISLKNQFIVFDVDNYLIQFFDSNYQWKFQIGGKGKEIHKLDMAYSGVIDKEYIYICDSNNDRIVKFDLNIKNSELFVCSKYKEGILKRPLKIAEDYNGYIYVADRDNNIIQIFDKNFHYKNSIGHNFFVRPTSVSILEISKNIFLYVLDRSFNTISRIFIFMNNKFLKEIKCKFIFNDPQDMYVTNSGIILIADTLNRRVCVIHKNNQFEIDLTKYSSNKRILIRSITFDEQAQEIIVVDFESSQILHFDKNGKFKYSFNPKPNNYLKYVRGISIYEDNYYLTTRSSKSVIVLDKNGQLINYIDKNYINGYFMKNPSQIIRRKIGDFLVVDKESDRILNFDSSFNYIDQFGFPKRLN